MTTDTRTPDRGLGVLIGTAAAAALLGLGLALVAGLVAGGSAARGGLAGRGLARAVIARGNQAVYLVAGVMPAASLLVALVTYTLQVVAMVALFALLTDSGVFRETLDRQWFGVAIIVVTVAWMIAQIVLTTRARIPAFDLTVRTQEAGER